MSFVQIFGSASGDEGEPEGQEEHRRPTWLGPPEGELGAVVPLGVVVGRSERGVVALSHAVAHSTGVALELAAEMQGLSDAQANRLFHEQHGFGAEEDLPEGFLRLGLELPGGVRVSNLGGMRQRRRLMRPDEEPDEPVFIPFGGGGGSAGGGRASLRPGYWLWPFPEPGTIRVACEWPIVGIPLSAVDVDGVALAAATARVVPLWPTP